jgi:hypothetical protein
MGLPDLPCNGDEDHTGLRVEENAAVFVNGISDGSDDESVDMEASDNQGYQPIGMDNDFEPADDAESDDGYDEMETDQAVVPETSNANEPVEPDFTNYEVWNAPRPEELSIEIDQTKAQEVMLI